jgi:hypothetical protein
MYLRFLYFLIIKNILKIFCFIMILPIENSKDFHAETLAENVNFFADFIPQNIYSFGPIRRTKKFETNVIYPWPKLIKKTISISIHFRYGGPCVEVFRDFTYLSAEIYFVPGNIFNFPGNLFLLAEIFSTPPEICFCSENIFICPRKNILCHRNIFNLPGFLFHCPDFCFCSPKIFLCSAEIVGYPPEFYSLPRKYLVHPLFFVSHARIFCFYAQIICFQPFWASHDAVIT